MFSVSYRFKSNKEEDTQRYSFNNAYISVKELKEHIENENGLSSGIELEDPETGEVYRDDGKVAKNSLVLVSRLAKKSQRSNGSFMTHSAIKRVPAANQTPPAGLTYVCNRCRKSGHYIQNCPTNGNPDFDRPLQRFVGIPLSMTKRVSSGDTSKPTLVLPDGNLAVLVPNDTVFEAGRASLLALEAEKKSVPEEFRCSMCQNVFKKPMRVPCCSAVFCQACIEPSTSADPVQCPICRKVSLFERLVADEELELSIERWRRDREGREDEPPRAEGVEPGRSTELEKPQVDDGGSLLLPAGTGGATVSNCVAESINVKRPPKIKRPPPPPRQVGIAEAAINSKAQQGESDGASEKKREGEEVQNLSSSAQVASSPIDGSKDEPKDGSKDEPGDGSGDALRREEDAGKESREAERRLPGPSSDEGRRKGWRASRDSSSRRKGRKRSSSPDAFMDSSDSQLTEEGSSAKRRRRLSGSPEVEGHRHRYRDEEKRRIEREDGHYGRVEEVKRADRLDDRKRRHYGDDYYRHEECLYEGEHDYRYHRLRRDEELLESENHRGRCCYVGASSSNVSSHRYREDEAAPCHHHECDCRRYRDSDSSHRHHHRHSPSRQHSAHGNHECHCRHWSGYHRYHDAEHYYDDPSGHEKEEDQPRGGEDKKKKRKKRHGRRDNQNAAHVADDPKYSADVFDDGNRYAVESKADDVVSTDPTVSSANRVARKSRKEDVPRKRASTTRPGELARDGACSSSNNGRCTEEQHRPQHHRDAPSVDHPSDQGNPKPASARNPPKQTKKKKSRSSHRRGRRRSRAHSSSHKTNDKNNNNKRLRTSHP